MTVKYILVDGVRLEHSRSLGLKSLRDLLGGPPTLGKLLSPITLATSEVAIYLYTYVDIRQCIHMRLRKLTMSIFKIKDISYMRFLVVWVSVITCIIVTALLQVVFPLLPFTRKHIFSSHRH